MITGEDIVGYAGIGLLFAMSGISVLAIGLTFVEVFTNLWRGDDSEFDIFSWLRQTIRTSFSPVSVRLRFHLKKLRNWILVRRKSPTAQFPNRPAARLASLERNKPSRIVTVWQRRFSWALHFIWGLSFIYFSYVQVAGEFNYYLSNLKNEVCCRGHFQRTEWLGQRRLGECVRCNEDRSRAMIYSVFLLAVAARYRNKYYPNIYWLCLIPLSVGAVFLHVMHNHNNHWLDNFEWWSDPQIGWKYFVYAGFFGEMAFQFIRFVERGPFLSKNQMIDYRVTKSGL